jgi:hypothetical protein
VGEQIDQAKKLHWQASPEVEMRGAGRPPGAGGSHVGIAGYQSYHPALAPEPPEWQCELRHPWSQLPWNGDPAWEHQVLREALQDSRMEQLSEK